ncbi:NADP-dependent oxidoreductase [Cysteiniphilum halobium]|uniref:NADP-dependent oxidoreductase n=1 Tax=Cysteiniphilum halobium TaxID=2219059 RepID=UPI003F82D498
MKAIQFNAFGSPEVLQYTEVDTPKIDPADQNMLLIKVVASGVNPIDAKIRNGSSFASANIQFPSGIGFDISGEVIDKSIDVQDIAIGQHIIGRLGFDNINGYSQYCKIKTNQVVIKPEKLTWEQAACLPIAGLTAWQALHTHGKLQQHERVLIHAGAGGVGHLAIQLAKAAGAYVITTASKKNHDFVKSLGADEVIDYQLAPFENTINNIDLVIDLIGGDTGIRSFKTLKSNGRLVTIPTNTKDKVLTYAGNFNHHACGMLAETNLSQLNTLAKLCADGHLYMHAHTIFALEKAYAAHQLLETGHTIGKISLRCV